MRRPRHVAVLAAPALVALVALVAPACSSTDRDKESPTTANPKPTTTDRPDASPTTTSSGGGSIADVDFQNFTFRYPSAAGEDATDLDEVTVVDGEYSTGEAPDNFDFQVVDVDVADLDGDGVAEAAISIYYNTGGSGQFTDVLVYRWSAGEATFVTAAGVGDRGDGGVDDVRTEPASGTAGDALVIRRNADAEGACCPTALEEARFRLDGSRLVALGEPEKWGIVRVGLDADGNATSTPTVVKFLPGTSRADLSGDATTPVAASFEATAGQRLELSLDVAALRDNPLVVELSGPGGQGGRAGTDLDPTLSVTLPDTGTYTLQFTPVGEVEPDLGVYFDADLRIT